MFFFYYFFVLSSSLSLVLLSSFFSVCFWSLVHVQNVLYFWIGCQMFTWLECQLFFFFYSERKKTNFSFVSWNIYLFIAKVFIRFLFISRHCSIERHYICSKWSVILRHIHTIKMNRAKKKEKLQILWMKRKEKKIPNLLQQ